MINRSMYQRKINKNRNKIGQLGTKLLVLSGYLDIIFRIANVITNIATQILLKNKLKS